MLLQDLHVVVKVAEFGSITAAAAHLDMQTATASAALKRVEKSLGAELFVRTTRQLRLSSAGERYLPQCQQALDVLERARQNLASDRDVVEGELRISVSSDLGRNVVTPWLDDFMDSHEKVSVKTLISDSNVDFYRDGVDLALRYGSPNDANLYGFKICNVPRLLCATQAYLSDWGVPSHPQDLVNHNGLFYQLHDVTHDLWTFSRGPHHHKVKMRGNRASNDGDLVRRWCVASKGVAAKSCLDMAADLLSGKVVSLMPEYRLKATELWLVCPSRQSITPAVRLLRDAFREKAKAMLCALIEQNILNPTVLED